MRLVTATVIVALAGCAATGSASRITAAHMGAADPEACARAIDSSQGIYTACRSAQDIKRDRVNADRSLCYAESRRALPTDAEVKEASRAGLSYRVAATVAEGNAYTQCVVAAGHPEEAESNRTEPDPAAVEAAKRHAEEAARAQMQGGHVWVTSGGNVCYSRPGALSVNCD